jgi:hypothetical protein
MMIFTCTNCSTQIQVQQLVGHGVIPNPHVPLNTFCSDKCLNEYDQKTKDNANDN